MVASRDTPLAAPHAAIDSVLTASQLERTTARIFTHFLLVTLAPPRPNIGPDVTVRDELDRTKLPEHTPSNSSPSMLDLPQPTFFCKSASATTEHVVIDHFADDDPRFPTDLIAIFIRAPSLIAVHADATNALLPQITHLDLFGDLCCSHLGHVFLSSLWAREPGPWWE
jgi:hypothetical protein